MPYLGLLHSEPLSLHQSRADLYLYRRHSNTVLSQSLGVPWVLVRTRFVWALWASLAGMGFDSNCEFAPPTITLGLLLALMHGVSPHSCSSAYHPTGVSLTPNVGYLLSAGPAKRSRCSWSWTWGVSPHSHCSWPWMWGISILFTMYLLIIDLNCHLIPV